MNNTWRSKCYNKHEFPKRMKLQSKDQTKKMKEKNIKRWFAQKSNIEKTLMGGWSTIDMHGTWHPIPFGEDGMAW